MNSVCACGCYLCVTHHCCPSAWSCLPRCVWTAPTRTPNGQRYTTAASCVSSAPASSAVWGSTTLLCGPPPWTIGLPPRSPSLLLSVPDRHHLSTFTLSLSLSLLLSTYLFPCCCFSFLVSPVDTLPLPSWVCGVCVHMWRMHGDGVSS